MKEISPITRKRTTKYYENNSLFEQVYSVYCKQFILLPFFILCHWS
jgi:hypothetical protein